LRAHRTNANSTIMNDLELGAEKLLAILKPDTIIGAATYLLVFVAAALLLTRLLRAALHTAMTRQGHVDRTTVSFLQQAGSAAIWVIILILYAHLIPLLRSMGTALLAGASVASVVIGLAAQSTLGNLVAGVAITLYRPFRLGDTLQVSAPTGTEVGTVEMISLGYTTLRTPDGRLVVLPNSLAASQVALNLRSGLTAAPLTILIRVAREADLESARSAALTTAREALDPTCVLGCFLTRIDAAGTTLELRIRPPAGADRDTLRSQLLDALARQFAARGLDKEGIRRPSFS
jgi:small conductance mechanosensitive channel